MECQLCELSPFWTHFWIALGPILTLIGAFFLVRVALLNLRSQEIQVGKLIKGKLTRFLRRLQFWKRQQTIGGESSVNLMAATSVAKGTVSARLYKTSEDMAAVKAAVERMRKIESKDAFGAAATEAAEEMSKTQETLEEKLMTLGYGLAGEKMRSDAQKDRADELHRQLRDQDETARLVKAEVLEKISELEGRGFWWSVWAALLIPLGILIGLIVDICMIGC